MGEQRRQIGRRAFVTVAGAAAVGLAGCSGTGGTGETTTATARGDAEIPSHGGAVGYTYQRPTGNRVVAGESAVPEADPIDVSVDWTPAWVVGVSGTGTSDNGVSGTGTSGNGEDRGETASRWAIVGESGEVAGVRIRDGEASTTEIAPNEIPSEAPPVLRGGRPPEIPVPPARPADSARATHPVPVENGLLAISTDGDLVLWDGTDGDGDGTSDDGGDRTEIDRLALDALPDARIVTAGGTDRKAFVFADATRRYDHAVLGDDVEAGSVAVVDHDDGLSELTRIRPNPADSAVFEGIAPIVADLTGDGEREVVVTESDGDRGARVVAFDARGERLATGPAIGHGYGWRHQLAVAPFAPDGSVEIAAVRTPHVGQTAEFYRLVDGELRTVGTTSGYSSHAMGSRNLDGGLAGDLDGDGRIELLVPTADRRKLGAVRRTQDGAEGIWEVGLGGELTTNLGAVASGGQVTIAAGWDGAVRFWSGAGD
jgi:hypothetical protein